MNDLTSKKIRFSDVARSIGVSNKTLRNWLARKDLDLLLLTETSADGWTEFTLGDVAILALTSNLVRWGLSVSYANEIAYTEICSKSQLLLQYKNTPKEALVAFFQPFTLFAFGSDENGDVLIAVVDDNGSIPAEYPAFLTIRLGKVIEDAFNLLTQDPDEMQPVTPL